MASQSIMTQSIMNVFLRELDYEFCYFRGMAGNNERSRAILYNDLQVAMDTGRYDANTCEAFKDWFRKIDAPREEHYDEFITLAKSLPDFRQLCSSLYCDQFRLTFPWDVIPLRCSDQKVLKMNKDVAASESVVLSHLFDSVEDPTEIPVPGVSSHVLSQVIQFCQKKHDFGKVLQSLLGHFNGWVEGFLDRNRTILSDLHQAADYLNIPGLLVFTSQAVGDMMGKRAQKLTDWRGKLSLSQMLSSLAVGLGGEDLGLLRGGGPWGFAS